MKRSSVCLDMKQTKDGAFVESGYVVVAIGPVPLAERGDEEERETVTVNNFSIHRKALPVSAKENR